MGIDETALFVSIPAKCTKSLQVLWTWELWSSTRSSMRILINQKCQLGENPLWHQARQSLYWSDIEGGMIHRSDTLTGKHDVVYRGSPVGGFTFQTDGNLLLFRRRDIVLLHTDGRLTTLREFSDEGMVRFNDVIADPAGRVFAGSIGKNAESGGLYRMDVDGTITRLRSGTACSNGMGFSPDQKFFYWTCSTTRRIYRFDYESGTGELGEPVLFHQALENEGIPDGLAVDASGHIWSARWDGFGAVRLDPEGKILEKIFIPVAQVTSLCLGGSNFDRLYITSAGGQPDSNTLDGAVFEMQAPHPGLPEFESRIRLDSAY